MKNIFYICLVLILNTTIQAQTTYYIDATSGNDTDNGTTTASAWKTINKVNQQTFSPGDSILFKRNETWNDDRLYIENTVGTSLSPIVYAAYGSGVKPVITSVVPQSHTWISSATNIWKSTTPPAEHPERLLIDNTEQLRANIMSELDGVNYFWFYDTTNLELYIHATANPNSLVISYSTDFPLIIGGSNYIHIHDMDFQGGWTAIYITSLSKNILLKNLTIGKYSREGIIIASDENIPAEFPENITVDNCTIDAFFAFDYSNAPIYTGSYDRGSSDGYRANQLVNGVIKNSYFKNWGHASFGLEGADITNVSIHNNIFTSLDICYGGRMGVDDASYCEVYNNEIVNTSVQSQLNGQNNHYHHNIFKNTTNTPLVTDVIDAAIELQGYSESVVINNIYEHNIILNSEGPGFRISGNNDHEIYNNTIRNNIFYNCGSVANDISIKVETDLYQDSHDNLFLNNLAYNSNTAQTYNFRDTLYNIANFNAHNGTDGYVITNNIFGDPLLQDLANDDFHLLINSPCINAGTTTLAAIDYDGNGIPYNSTASDIGLYEFQGPTNIESYNNSSVLTIAPNPAADFISITIANHSKIESIHIYDTNGKRILSSANPNQKIDVSELALGVYLIQVNTKNKSLFTKFSKF